MGVSRTASKHLQALVLNAGSSSLKYGLYNLTPHGKLAPLASGQVERIGQGAAGAASITLYDDGRQLKSRTAPGDYRDHSASLSAVVDLLKVQRPSTRHLILLHWSIIASHCCGHIPLLTV